MTGGVGFRSTILVWCSVFVLAAASPVYMPQFLPGGAGRNIRNLPCVSRRTGETGICMFAFTCLKANGTHLGTCIDSFYFGSCCKMDGGEPDIYPHDNSIDEGPTRPYPTSHGALDNNIPVYSPRPTPKPTSITAKPPVRVTEAVKTTQVPVTITQKPVKNSEKPLPATTRSPVSKPVRVTFGSTDKYATRPGPDSTTDSVGLSTFQTVENNPSKTSPTPRPSSTVTTKSPEKKPTTASAATNTKPRPTGSKPIATGKPNTTKIDAKPSTKPSVSKITTLKPSVSQNTATTQKVSVTTSNPIATTASRPTISGTRFPPRNATTTTTTTTLRPRPTPSKWSAPTVTKKPPTPPVKRITTTSTTPTTPVHGVTLSSRPSTVAGKKNSTTQIAGSWPTKTPTTATRPHGGYKPTSSGQRPSVTSEKPTTPVTTSSTVIKQPTKRPTTQIKPIATPATPNAGAGSSRPGVTTLKPSVTRPKPTSTLRPSVTKPKPVTTQVHETLTTTEAPLKRPSPTTTTVTVADTVVTRRPVSSSSQPSPTTPKSPSLSTSSISNEVISVDDTTNRVDDFDDNKAESTSSSPGLVTWTSNSDDATTRSPGVATSTTEEPTNTEWTPITTPDGWVLIQSPSPNEPNKNDVKPTVRPTTQSSVSDKPITALDPTTERPTARPSLPTVAMTPTTTDNYIPTAEMNMSDYKQVCGRRLFPESRIVGGSRSSFGKWPWQISLRQWRTSTYLHKCGAALLNENWAITAAHCVENVPPSDLLLRLGEHDLASEEEPYGFQERRVQIVASHPQFDPRTFEYDLALLRFYEPLLPFQPNTLPICLPDDDANYVGLTAHVTGWGRLYEDGPLPSILQEVPVPVINNTVCEAMYRSAGYIEHIPKIFICAGWRKGGFDSCEGDSGGPLVIQRPRDKRWILAGVISWGIGCAEPNQPGVYTRISEFREWINQILQF